MVDSASSGGIFRDPKWLALWAAMSGYLLDAMDFLLYVFALQTIRAEFHLSNQQAGLINSAGLIASALGGIGAGLLCDRIGRKPTLILTILAYSLACGGMATANGFVSLIVWRALIGLGLGGEWSAGAVLVSESWPAEHRGKAIALMQSGWALGYIAAAALSAWILPAYGWRVLFVCGLLPALLTLFVRANVQEPAIWNPRESRDSSLAELFRGGLAARTIRATLLATCVLFAYWGWNTWLPGFLSAPASAGGAGLTIFKTSNWVIAMQLGAFAGYLTFGWLADRFGRRPAFAFYVAAAAVLSCLYGTAPGWAGGNVETVLLVLGPFMGFFGTGFFSLFGSMLAELYPTRIRGAGQGFAYNFGRGLSALAPFAIGALADRYGLGLALTLNAAFFLLGAILVFTLPETRRTDLRAV
jgi:MFS family permease